MGVVVEGDDAGRLGRAGHHHPDVLADLLQVVHEVGVTGVEADPAAGEVGALGQRVHRHDAVEPVLEDAAAGTVPRELDVALVGEHRHAVGATPRGDRAEVVDATGRVARAVDPQGERPVGVGGIDRGQVDAAAMRCIGTGTGRHPARMAPIS